MTHPKTYEDSDAEEDAGDVDDDADTEEDVGDPIAEDVGAVEDPIQRRRSMRW